MPPVLKRWIRRLLLLVLVLAILAVAAFTWFCYWPLEAGQGAVEDLVPGSSDFLIKTSWHELRDTGFLQKNLRDQPLVPALKEAWVRDVRPALDRLAQIEQRINGQIPLGLSSFSVEDDLFPAEFVAAGRWCRDIPPPQPPSWRELLVLFRTGWKVRAAVAALEHGFVRDLAQGDGVEISATEDEGVYKVVLRGVPVRDLRARSTCGDGFVMPPDNVWYLARIKDVIAWSNSQNLILKAVDLGRGGSDPFTGRPGIDLSAPDGSFAAAMDLRALQVYLRRLVESGGPRASALKYFLGIEALDRMNGHLSIASPDLIAARGMVRLEDRGLLEPVRANFAAPPLDLREGLASFLPAADTFALVQLRSDPLHLLNALHDGLLTSDERDLWRDNMLRGGEYQTMDAFLRDIAQYLGDAFAVSLGRLSGLYDTLRYPDMDTDDPDPERRPDPLPSIAFVVPLRQGAKQTEVDAFLAARVHLMGFSKDLERVSYRGFEYTRLKFMEKLQSVRDLMQFRPAYLLVQDRLVFANHEDYFKQVLDTLADPQGHPSLARDPAFQIAMAALPPRGHLSVWADLEKLTRVPGPAADPRSAPDPEGGPRGFLWDGRQTWVRSAKDPRQKAIEARTQILKRYGSAQLTLQQDEAVENEVQRVKAEWMARYPEFLEEYRQLLEGYRRARAFGVVLAAQGKERLQAEAALLLSPSPSARGAPP